jgi:hypothetical protein
VDQKGAFGASGYAGLTGFGRLIGLPFHVGKGQSGGGLSAKFIYCHAENNRPSSNANNGQNQNLPLFFSGHKRNWTHRKPLVMPINKRSGKNNRAPD